MLKFFGIVGLVGTVVVFYLVTYGVGPERQLPPSVSLLEGFRERGYVPETVNLGEDERAEEAGVFVVPEQDGVVLEAAIAAMGDMDMGGMDMSGGGTMQGMDMSGSTSSAMDGMDMSGTATTMEGMDMSGGDTAMAGMDMSGSDTAMEGMDMSGSDTAMAGMDMSGSDTAMEGMDMSGGDTAMAGMDMSGSDSAMEGMDMSGSDTAMAGMDMSGNGEAVLDMDMNGDGIMDMSSAAMGNMDGMNMGSDSADMASMGMGDIPMGEGGLGFAEEAAFDRVIELSMTEWGYSEMQIDVKMGERIKFVVKNQGQIPHEFMFMNMPLMAAANYRGTRADWSLFEHEALFEQALVLPGGEFEFVLQVQQNGAWMFMCMLPYHMQMGMMGQMATQGAAMEM